MFPTLEPSPQAFQAALYQKLQGICPGIAGLEFYEFCYGLHNITPAAGWGSITAETMESIERRVNDRAFYDSIQIKPSENGRIVLDDQVLCLTQRLCAGLVSGAYPAAWVDEHFYFDIRGFYFLHRTLYFTEKIREHLGGKPYRQFEQKQKQLEGCQSVGYKAFKEANAEVDRAFIECVQGLIRLRGTPVVMAIAGPTAAGKTEIVERLTQVLQLQGRGVASIELDNFLTDREPREQKGIFTQGKEAFHFELFLQALDQLTRGQRVSTPRYDFVYATSSHDQHGNLKPGGVPVEIEPAEIIFIEGNFPFLIQEALPWIGIKVVYLTDDPMRLKRKWKRDIDYRKKYEPTYFRNRYFKDQFIMAEVAYRPQMEVCDLLVDTSGAALWVTPEVAGLLGK